MSDKSKDEIQNRHTMRVPTEVQPKAQREADAKQEQQNDSSIAWSGEQAADVPGAEPVPVTVDTGAELSLPTKEDGPADQDTADGKAGSESR